MENDIELRLRRTLQMHGFKSYNISEDSIIRRISVLYSPLTLIDFELFSTIQKLVVYLYKLKVANTQFSIEKHEIEPDVRQFMIESLSERIHNMLTQHGTNYEYLKRWVDEKIKDSFLVKWKDYGEFYSIRDDIESSVDKYIVEQYKTLIFSIEQLPTALLKTAISEAYEHVMVEITAKYHNIQEEGLTPLEIVGEYKIIDNIEDVRKIEFKDPLIRSMVLSGIQNKTGMRVLANDKGETLIVSPRTKTTEEEFYDLCKEILELKPRSLDLSKPADAIVKLNNLMLHYSPRPYHQILDWFEELRNKLEYPHRSPEYRMVEYFCKVMGDKDDERIQDIPLFLKIQYLYSILEYEVMVNKSKSKVATCALIYDLLIVLNQLKCPEEYTTFGNKDKYDRIKRYLEVDKDTGIYKMMI